MTEKKLEETKLRFLKNNIEIYNNNKELVLLYETYIEKIVELFDFIMKKDEHLFYTIVFDILCEIGFFSFNNSFNSDKDNFKELSIKPGISIVNGEGVCRNISCFYEDIFRYFYNYPLKICCLDQQVNIEQDANVFGNHIINLTYYHDTIYGFDNMNHCLFKCMGCDELNGVGFDYHLKYTPYGDILIRLTTELVKKDNYILETSFKKNLLYTSSKKKFINEDEFNKLVNYADTFIGEKKKILKSFLIDNLKYKDEIREKMLTLK